MTKAPARLAALGFAGLAGLLLAGCSAGGNGASAQESSGVVAAAAATTSAGSVAPESTLSLITARGTGRATGTPDVVTVTLGVETRSPSATTALADNSERAAAVIAILKERGVADEDLQTSQLSIYPSYDQNNQVTGYQVTNLVTATIRDVAGAGAAIDAAGGAAGDAIRVQNISFSIDSTATADQLRSTARADAVTRAKTQAEELAAAAGVALGRIHSITETAADTPIPYALDASEGGASAPVPLEAGSLELTVQVQVVYEIAQ